MSLYPEEPIDAFLREARDWVAAAKRICAVSLAIDSWRHWLAEGT